MEEYVAEHQDRSKNALDRSTEAAFVSWLEDLKADEALFMSDKIMSLGFALQSMVIIIFTGHVLPLCVFGGFQIQLVNHLGPRRRVKGRVTRAKLVKQLEDSWRSWS